ncbi:MAG: bifunctional 5,10-methylenetetrahydrofolate dehydrogenase/5,10-methenyltetrahydrofolate cyclohydrolase [Candidatus Aureabacteria bacterium]|nr:bifunctional 5,10-methylenetetrahydrofolate dehydrogenase/5,10-methenyltetrahydrofolate cyclohydrolase [Candidatus Auribacterota bacterium]
MTAQLIDGKTIAGQIREEVRKEAERLFQEKQVRVKLTVILVGSNPASQVYVKNKRIACEKTNILSEIIQMEESVTEARLLDQLKTLNEDGSVHGILVQLPLPSHIDENKVILSISPCKDVDGFHPVNVGNLLIGRPFFKPCTPAGIVELLRRYHLSPAGKNVVIIGRSNIVGKPLAALLMQKGDFADATVTVCHSRTKGLEEHALRADILIAAIGSAGFVKGNMIREGAVVIDVGMNRIPDPSTPSGSRLCGDVAYEEALNKASWITPVPGGVGPMTIAMLLKNTLLAAGIGFSRP